MIEECVREIEINTRKRCVRGSLRKNDLKIRKDKNNHCGYGLKTFHKWTTYLFAM